jgi:hypothetical protein
MIKVNPEKESSLFWVLKNCIGQTTIQGLFISTIEKVFFQVEITAKKSIEILIS